MATQKVKVKVHGHDVELKATSLARYEDEVAEVMVIIGSPDAPASEKSLLSDFGIASKGLDMIRRASGKPFGEHARVLDVAKAIRARNTKAKRSKTNRRDANGRE